MYDDLKKNIVWLPFVLLAILVAGWYVFRTERDDGHSAIEQTRSELNYIAEQQLEAKQSVERAGEAISRSQERNSVLQDVNRADADLISESQQIVGILKQRAEQKEHSN